jgi:hypothetical protein
MITALWLGLTTIAHSQTTSSPALGTSGSWLVLPSSVRAEGLAEAYVGVADDIGSMNINPAGLGQIQDSQITLMHNGWVQGMIEEQARTSFQFSGGVAAVGLGYLNGGTIDRVVIVSGSPVLQGTFQPTALRLDLGYGIEMIKDWYFGASATLEEDSLDADSQWGGMGNLGVLGKWGSGFRTGLALVNIGGTAGYGTPVQWRLGASYDAPVDNNIGHLLVSAQGGTLFVDPGIGALSFGVEYLYHDTVAVRLGHQFGAYGGLTGLTGFSIGAGVKLEKWELDYALVTRGDLGTSNMISFNYNFGKEEGSPTPKTSATPIVSLQPSATATPIPKVVSTPTPAIIPTTVPQPIASSTPAQVSSDNWWSMPFDALASFEKLKTQMVPEMIGKGQMAALDKNATAFFNAAQKDGASEKDVMSLKAGYYAAVASEFFTRKQAEDAAIYLNTAFSIQADNVDALALKVKMDKASVTPVPNKPPTVTADDWWDKPFDALSAFEKLKTQLVPELMTKKQMPLLGKCASSFFDAAKKDGATPQALATFKSGYYAAIASELLTQNRAKDALYYSKLALSIQSDNADALAVKAKLDQTAQ